MKIKMLTTSASPDGTYVAGSIRMVTEVLGKALIKGKYAELVEQDEPKAKKEENEKETATAEPDENAMMEPPKRRRKKNEDVS